MNTNIHVNVNEIPPEVAERIGCVFLGFHKRFQQSPELMAELEAYRAARQEAPSWLVSALKNAKQTPLFGVLAQKTN